MRSWPFRLNGGSGLITALAGQEVEHRGPGPSRSASAIMIWMVQSPSKPPGHGPDTNVARTRRQQYLGTSAGRCASRKNIIHEHHAFAPQFLPRTRDKGALNV